MALHQPHISSFSPPRKQPRKQPRSSSKPPRKQPRKQPRSASKPPRKQPRTAPSTPPSSSRRQSFSATDVFVSPIEWSKAPGYRRDAADTARILDKGAVMCRGDISQLYIENALADPGVSVWVVRDSQRRMFGFALTREHATHVELVLICTHKRKGEGMQLFKDILAYSSVHGTEVRLEAVTGDVANKYATAARARGFGVFVNGRTLATPLDPHDSMIPMTFRPSGHRR